MRAYVSVAGGDVKVDLRGPRGESQKESKIQAIILHVKKISDTRRMRWEVSRDRSKA